MSISKLIKTRRGQLFALLALTTLFNFVLLAYRLHYIEYDFSHIDSVYDLARYRGKPTFFFLIWNLFLAWIPFWIALSLEKLSRSKILVGIALLLWLLFFPNAPYIVTDLLHLRHHPPVPYWYDLMLLFSFAWTGLMLGFLSLMEVQKFLEKRLPFWWARVFVWLAIFLCGLGVFMGRFQRWNSWDVLTDPFAIMEDVTAVLFHPFTHLKTFGIAIVISGMMLLGHWTISVLESSKSNHK